MRNASIGFLAALALSGGGAAHAAGVTVTAQVRVVDSDGDVGSSVFSSAAIGDVGTLSFTYEDSTPGSFFFIGYVFASPLTAASLTLNSQSYSLAFNDYNSGSLVNSFFDALFFEGSDSTSANQYNTLSFGFADGSATTLGSNNLPSAINVGDWDALSGSLSTSWFGSYLLYNESFDAGGDATLLLEFVDARPVVPPPSAAGLGFLGLGALVGSLRPPPALSAPRDCGRMTRAAPRGRNHLGCRLTERWQIDPEPSAGAIIVRDPAAKRFAAEQARRGPIRHSFGLAFLRLAVILDTRDHIPIRSSRHGSRSRCRVPARIGAPNILYNFTGDVTNIAGSFGATGLDAVSVGDAVALQIAIDAATPDTGGGPVSGGYGPGMTHFRWSIGSLNGELSPIQSPQFNFTTTVDHLTAGASGDIGGVFANFLVMLQSSGDPFTNDHLPTTLNVADFDQLHFGQLELFDFSDGAVSSGSMHFNFTGGSAVVAPLPTSAALGAGGLAAMCFVTRPRRR